MVKPATKLAAVTAEVSQGIRILAKASDELSRRGRAAINGVFGGSLCATLGYIASIGYPALDTSMFFGLVTLTGLAGGVALTRGFLMSQCLARANESAIETNNAVFAELIERAQNPALLPAQKKLILDRAVAISLELGQVPLSSSDPQQQIAGPSTPLAGGVPIK